MAMIPYNKLSIFINVNSNFHNFRIFIKVKEFMTKQLNSHRRFNSRMRIVIFQRKIFKIEIENVFDFGI